MKELSLLNYQCIGFDLDHTLARYKVSALNQLIHTCLIKHLVHGLNYPESLLELKYEDSFAKRGVVIDRLKGNILKLDAHACVRRAFHGRQALAGPALQSTYPRPLQMQGRSTAEYFVVATFFEV